MSMSGLKKFSKILTDMQNLHQDLIRNATSDKNGLIDKEDLRLGVILNEGKDLMGKKLIELTAKRKG